MRIFLDTNVLLDFLQEGRSNNETAELLFEVIKKRGIEAFVSTQSVLDMVYVASKIDRDKTFRFVEYLLGRFNVRTIDYFSLMKALKSGYHDLEDNAQIACADGEFCHVFLTSDKGILARDLSPMLVMTSTQFLEMMS